MTGGMLETSHEKVQKKNVNTKSQDTQTTQKVSENGDVKTKSFDINCLKPEALITIPLMIDDHEIDALIDTGAKLALIRKSELNILKGNYSISKTSQVVVGLGDSKIKVNGSILLYYHQHYSPYLCSILSK